MIPNSDEIEFWETRYQAGKTPWDFHGVPCALTNWLNTAPTPGRVLIPGCGSGYEVQAFHAAGWETIGIDYTPAAVARAKARLGELADKVMQSYFFTHKFGSQKFDLIYERTFLCALPPERRTAYVARMAELLVDGGKLLGFFLYGHDALSPVRVVECPAGFFTAGLLRDFKGLNGVVEIFHMIGFLGIILL